MNEENKHQYRFEFPTPPKMDFASEVAETTRLMREIGQMGQKLVEAQMHIWESISESLSSLHDIDWEDVEQSNKEAAESLAQKGWTLPMNMDIEEIFTLSQVESQEEVDSSFHVFYSNEKEYQNIKTDILKHELIKEWRGLLSQCFDSYEKGHYLIVIPSLFIVIESLANMLISPRFQKYITTEMKKKPSLRVQFKKVKREIEDDKTNIIIYVSVMEFLYSVFRVGNFDKNTSRFQIINRDWVLHGRDYPNNWTQVDALRLFNAIHTIIQLDFLLEDLEREEAEAESIK
ncbi:hypothetical protein LKL81_24275 [Bacillus paranthracis]|uniref:hypothetical protein n=1 Tax=Bacillus TaxID=1386 RepID=UPI00027A33DB|nr:MULTISPECIES: hypothetical protein [Bacillus]EJR17887.1 hypothetical protein II9_02089 [Bacillus cereus MSX-D12]KMP40163.1 hypothetical protein TU55_24260 [Bacillus cereus]MCC2374074.1 hypothetical protein [Bacillus paranthracis]MCC2430336.1 hypothetical protein [Bacillus paranthracis]MDC7738924.1 hypothetical protein [Bacillus sp. FF-1]